MDIINKILLFFNDSSNASLVLFFIILGFYVWYTFAIIYHLIRFGVGIKPKALALLFFMGSLILFAVVLDAYYLVDWKEIFQQILNGINLS